MKLEMDEKLKHRLVGVAVIVSIAAIFAPAIMKKSNQKFDNKVTMQVKLPPKPLQPNIVIKSEKELFKTVHAAPVELLEPAQDAQLPRLAKAEMIKNNPPSSLAKIPTAQQKPHSKSQLASNALPETKLALSSIGATANTSVKKAIGTKKIVTKPERYAVQLASFSKLENAKSLEMRLRTKGFQATISKSKNGSHELYKVYVGNALNKNDAQKLKNQLTEALQLKGLIVNGVS